MTSGDDANVEDPWQRFRWFMSSVWLVFLAYPLFEVLTTGPPAGRVLGTLAIVAFAAVYLNGFHRLYRGEAPPRVAAVHLALLVLLAVGVGLHIGREAFGMACFVVAFSTLSLPIAGAMAVLLAALATSVLVPLWTGTLGRDFFFALIVLLVGVVTGVVSLIDRRGEEYKALQHELVVADERDRMARDVHDVVGHSLTAVSVKAELAERLVDLDPERAKAELAAIRSLTREALGEVRAAVTGLRVARLGEELERARAALSDAGISVSVRGEPATLDPRHRLVSAWVLREAATNVVRHSGAADCTIEVGTRSLCVRDNGVGIDGRPEGNGLRGVRDRVRAAGGQVTVGPAADGGTELKVDYS